MIRPILRGDKEELDVLFKQLTSRPVEIEIDVLLSDPDFYGIVAEKRTLFHRGKIIGFGSLSIYRSATKQSTGVIEDMVVDEPYRRKGWGKKILRRSIEIGKALKVKLIILTSNPERIAARKLYESEGFELQDTGFFAKKID